MAIVHSGQEDLPASSNTADQVRSDRLQLLYWQSFPAVFVSVAVASVLALLLWPAADQRAVTVWMALIFATSLARVALFLGYRLRAPTGLRLLDWERPYFVTLLASTLTWGLGSLWIMPRDSLLHQTMTLVILVGMAGGALSVYSAIRWLAITTIAVVLLPASLWVLVNGGQSGFYLGIAVILFCLSALRATKVLSTALQGNLEMTYALRDAKETAERMASVDMLTGLINRRAFVEQADAPFQFCRRNGIDLAVIVMDLDHFKQVNDTRGHAVGDLAIQHTGRLIEASLRKSDLCCRWGGEEFVILLPGTSLGEACAVAEKLRSVIAAKTVPAPGSGLSMTASLGVANGPGDLESLIGRADAAMYRAKREGRNRVARDEAGNAGDARPAT